MLQVGHLATAAHDRAHFGAWVIISSPLYLSFDLRNATRMDRAWELITNREAIAVNQQWAGHPGRLVKSWTPAAAKAAPNFLVTADLNSCQRGWSHNATTGQVELRQADCTSQACGCVATPAGPGAGGAFPCRMVAAHEPSFDAEARYCDDAELRVVPCDTADPAQRFMFGGDAAAGTAGLLSPGATAGAVHVRPMPWYEGAGVQLSADSPRQLVFNGTAGGTLKTPGNHLASDTCLNASPTFDDADALLLWAKPQPGGAVAVFLLNNHPTESYSNASFSTAEVGFAAGAPAGEAAVRDIWRRQGIGLSTGGVVTLDVMARDSRLVLLTQQG